MTEQDKNTEAKILEAARKVFIRKGLDGARMQEIADEAGINKALLHYYFRSKNNLFEKVFNEAFITFIPKVFEKFTSDISIFDKIRFFVESYITTLAENPYLPPFIMGELHKEPSRVTWIVDKLSGIVDDEKRSLVFQQVQKEIQNGTLRPIHPGQLIINMLGLCLFPFIARPILKKVFFDDNDIIYNEFLEQRKTEVTDFIINSIKN